MSQVMFVFVVGAALGLFYDSLHCYWNVLSYAVPHFWRESVFVPMNFGIATVAYYFVVRGLPRSVKSRLSQESVSFLRLLFDASLLLCAYLSNGLLSAPWGDSRTWFNVGILIMLGLIGFLSRNKWSWELLGLVLFLMIVGPSAEALLSRSGFFAYTHADWSGIPYWLPLLWFVAAQLFYSFGLAVLKFESLKAKSK